MKAEMCQGTYVSNIANGPVGIVLTAALPSTIKPKQVANAVYPVNQMTKNITAAISDLLADIKAKQCNPQNIERLKNEIIESIIVKADKDPSANLCTMDPNKTGSIMADMVGSIGTDPSDDTLSHKIAVITADINLVNSHLKAQLCENGKLDVVALDKHITSIIKRLCAINIPKTVNSSVLARGLDTLYNSVAKN